jgi:hypothetical protein
LISCTCCGGRSDSTAAWCHRCYSATFCGHATRLRCSCGNTSECGQCNTAYRGHDLFNVDLANQGLEDYARLLKQADEAS